MSFCIFIVFLIDCQEYSQTLKTLDKIYAIWYTDDAEN